MFLTNRLTSKFAKKSTKPSVVDKTHAAKVMKCTFQEVNYLCRARKEIYVPSPFEFREHCMNKQDKCEFYLKAVMASWRFSKRPFKLVPPRIIRIE